MEIKKQHVTSGLSVADWKARFNAIIWQITTSENWKKAYQMSVDDGRITVIPSLSIWVHHQHLPINLPLSPPSSLYNLPTLLIPPSPPFFSPSIQPRRLEINIKLNIKLRQLLCILHVPWNPIVCTALYAIKY